MDEIMDTKVVQMKFDNSQFRAGVEDTIKQLTNLENSLEMQGASKGLDDVAKASKETSKAINVVGESVESVHLAFSYLEVAGITAMVKLTNAALNYGKRIANNLWSKSIGQVIEGGKRRSQNISNAKFQLEGLGVAWDDIVDDINYGVKDTAYGLDEAATAASQLVASQVQLGDEMKTALRGISGTAAMTNSSFSEISNIWTTVASNGKLMTMQLRQLSARGLNASAVLAKAMGTTEAAINDMVTKGQIDFKTFAEAMDNAFGEHAKEANKTFQGALSNMNAALSRIGQKFADPVFENLRKIFIALTGDIDAVNKALQPAMDAFSSILGDAERVVEKFLTSEHFVKGLIALAVDFWTWVRTLVIAVQEFAGAGVYLDNITRPFESLAKSLQLYGDKAEYVKNIIKDVLAVGDIAIHGIKNALTILKALGEAILEGIGIPIQKLKEDFEPGTLYKYKEGFKAVMDVITDFIALKLANVISAIVRAIKEVPWKTVLSALVIIITYTSKAILLIPELIKAVKNVFKGLAIAIYAAGAVVTWFIEKVIDGANAVFQLLNSFAGSSIFGFKIPISFALNSNDVNQAESQAQTAYGSIAQQADIATESIDNLNGSIENTSNQMALTEKNISRSAEKMADSVENSADRVEDANDRMIAPTKGGIRPSRLDNGIQDVITPPEGDQQGSNALGLENLVNAHEVRDASEEVKKSIFDEVGEVFDSLKNDKSAQTGAQTAVGIWFGGIIEKLYESSGSWLGKLVLIVESLVPAILAIILVVGKVYLAVQSFKLIKGVFNVILGVLKGVADFFMSFGYFSKAIYKNAVANELRAVAELVRSLVGPILAIAAAFAVFVGAAYVIKKFDLEDIIDTLMKHLKSILIIIGIMMAISAVITKYQTINKVMQNLLNITAVVADAMKPKSIPGIFKASSTAHQFLLGMSALFISLAADLAVLSASIKILGEMDTQELIQGITALGVITIILGALIFAVGNFANAFRTYTYSYEELTGALSKSPFSRDKGVESKNNEMYKTLWALAGTIAAMTAAIVILGKQDIGTLLKGGIVIGVAMTALTFFLKSIMNASKSFKAYIPKGNGIEDIEKGPAESATIKSVIGLISGLAGFMLSISAVMSSAKNLDAGQLGVVTAIIATSLGALTGLMAVIAWNARQATEVPSKGIKSVYSGMSAAIFAVSIFMLSIAGSLLMIKDLDETQLAHGLGTLLISLILLGGFIGIMSGLLKSFSMTSELVVLAGSLLSMSVGLSIILLSISGMFSILQNVDWSAMEGSGKYLAGVLVFVGIMTGLVMLLSVLASGNAWGIIAASIGIFGGLSILMFSISKLFECMNMVDWSALDDAKPILLGLAAFIVGLSVLATVLGASGPVGLIAMAVVGVFAALILSLSALFISIGQCVNLIGSGVQKLADAIETIVNIPWHKASEASDGLSEIMKSLSRAAASMDFSLLSGALIFAGFTFLMAAAINALSGMDVSTVKQVTESINACFSSLSEDLEGKQAVVDFFVGLAIVLPIIAQSIAASIIILAVGAIGLVAFALEMIIFVALMQQVGDQIVPAMETFVNAIVGCGDVIFNKGLELLAGFAAIFAVATLAIVVGTLLTAGGALMAAGAGLMYLAGLTLAAGISMVVRGISKSGELILKNAIALKIGVTALSVLGVTMAAVGAILIIGGGLFAAGAKLTSNGAKLIYEAVKIFGTATVSAGIYANATVSQFRAMVQGLYQLAEESQGLGTAFAWAANMIVIGFIQGITDGIPVIAQVMGALGLTALEAFKSALGIASPATEMIEAAFWTVEGFVEGLTENAPSIQNVCTDIVEGIVNIFSNGGDEIAVEGGEAAIGFLDNVESVFSIGGSGIQDMLGNIGLAWGDGLGSGLEEGFRRHVENLIAYEQELASVSGPANWTPAEYSAYLQEAQRSGPNSNATQEIIKQNNANAENRARHDGLLGQIPTYTPLSTLDIGTDYIDIDALYNSLGGSSGGGGGYTSEMASAIAGSSGAGSGINDQSKAASIGGGVGNTITNSNNTYNFYQNNYSPEPLNRSAIYQQTRQQLNGFYTYVKEKNLSY